MIATIVLIITAYLTLAIISHREGLLMGSIIPSWLCVFCWVDALKEGYSNV